MRDCRLEKGTRERTRINGKITLPKGVDETSHWNIIKSPHILRLASYLGAPSVFTYSARHYSAVLSIKFQILTLLYDSCGKCYFQREVAEKDKIIKDAAQRDMVEEVGV